MSAVVVSHPCFAAVPVVQPRWARKGCWASGIVSIELARVAYELRQSIEREIELAAACLTAYLQGVDDCVAAKRAEIAAEIAALRRQLNDLPTSEWPWPVWLPPPQPGRRH